MNKPPSGEKQILPGERSGSVRIPSSKSVAHRMLICAALGDKPVTVELDGLSQDILATADCLRALGAQIAIGESGIRVSPVVRHGGESESTEEKNRDPETVLPAGESGSTLRFLLPLAGVLGKEAAFETEGRLSERPLAPLDEVLREHGLHISREGRRIRCFGKLGSGAYRLPGNVSSQFFSGLLMALPLAGGSSTLSVQGRLESAAYIRLTEQALKQAGVMLEARDGSGWYIPGGQTPQLPESVTVEGDWSNAAFFLALGALSQQGIRVEGPCRDSAQGDREILTLLRRFGAEVTEEETAVTVRHRECRPLQVDASGIPDLVPVLAVLCCAAEGHSEITNAARLRLKESDRLQTTAELLRGLGGEVQELPDGLRICGKGSLTGGRTDAHNDHRIAMSAAVAACLCREAVLLRGADCVRKSYPAFWGDFEGLRRAELPVQDRTCQAGGNHGGGTEE